MTVAYQGEPGAYSEAVIREAFGPEAKTVGFGTFAGAVASVHRGEADAAVIPVRNSQTGAVEAGAEAVADGLRAGLQSRGEVVLPVRHVLLALPGVSRGEIRRVRSHPEALLQCAPWLRTHLAHADPQPGPDAAPDTAGAAREIAAQGWRDAAAVAHRGAAERYGLVVLAEGIQGDHDNATTFAVLLLGATEAGTSGAG